MAHDSHRFHRTSLEASAEAASAQDVLQQLEESGLFEGQAGEVGRVKTKQRVPIAWLETGRRRSTHFKAAPV